MNPGKVVDPNPIDANLRLERGLPGPPGGATHLPIPAGRRQLRARDAALRRRGQVPRDDGGTMCPSYRATGEEHHSTRGRARLLFEMLRGEVIRGGWQSEEVKEALDLCLACKACKTMPGRRRHGDLQGRVPRTTTTRPGAGRGRPGSSGRSTAGRAPARALPGSPISSPERPGSRGSRRRSPGWRPSARSRASRGARSGTGFGRRAAPMPAAGSPTRRVLLLPDTFTEPSLRRSPATAVRSAGGGGVYRRDPRRDLCCGRPLYDFGPARPRRNIY